MTALVSQRRRGPSVLSKRPDAPRATRTRGRCPRPIPARGPPRRDGPGGRLSRVREIRGEIGPRKLAHRPQAGPIVPVVTELRDMFITYGPCVLQIAVRDAEGGDHSGTCFHIGDGYLVTARHVVDGTRILSIGDHDVGDVEVAFHPDEDVDLAILRTTLRLEPDRRVFADGRYQEFASAIPLGSHLDDWLNDDAFIAQKVLVMGYPPIPMAREPVLVTVEAEIVAVVDKYVGPRHPHFVLSNIPRGGFSGGPVLMSGFLLGVATESLLEAGKPLETGFAAALTVEPLLALMGHHRLFPFGWNGDWARELADGPAGFDDDWELNAHTYMPAPLPWWFRWRVRALKVASRHRQLHRLARRLTFHTRVGWRPATPPRR